MDEPQQKTWESPLLDLLFGSAASPPQHLSGVQGRELVSLPAEQSRWGKEMTHLYVNEGDEAT